MEPAHALAYLAGIIDGDGYLVVAKDYRTRRIVHPYYRTTLGVQQLWPGDAVGLFASVFDGKVTWWPSPGGRPMARCELHGKKALAAIRRLLPYLLVKKDQALLLLQVSWLRSGTRTMSPELYDRLDAIRRAVLSLHDGSWMSSSKPLPIPRSLRGYERLGPSELGWTKEQVLAYLAGVIDSDGNLRLERKRVKDMLSPHYRINARCSQVGPSPAVDLLAKTLGGRVRARKSRRPGHRDLVSWSLHDLAAMHALELLLPYLVVKRAEAYLLLDLRRLKAEGKKGTTEWVHPNRWRSSVKMRKRCYTSTQVAEFERIRQAVSALHSRDLIDSKQSQLTSSSNEYATNAKVAAAGYGQEPRGDNLADHFPADP